MLERVNRVRRGAAPFLAAVGLLLAGPLTARAAAPRLVRVGSAPVLPAGSQTVAAAASVQKLGVTIALAPRHPRALSAYARAVSDPESADYGRYLSPAQFAARYGPSAATLSQVRGALIQAGLKPGRLRADHLSLSLRADAAGLERGFHLELAHVRLPDHREVLVNRQAPALPAGVAAHVQAVIGLDGLGTWRSGRVRPRSTRTVLTRAAAGSSARGIRASGHTVAQACAGASATAGAQGAYTAGQIAEAYRFSDLYAVGDQGAGVSIGVYELEPDAPGDIAAYQSCYGTSAAVSYDKVDGGSGRGAGSGEAAFDIEQIIGLAPAADVVVYQGPNSNSDDPGSGPYDIFAEMISQDRVSVISNSWGECEAMEGTADAQAENTLFQEAAIQGQSVLSASGDYGAEDCYGTGRVPDTSLAVDDPGSQPYVTDVGGTSMTALGPPPTELAWNTGSGPATALGISSGAGAGGGGISSVWGMPAYQADSPAALGVINADSSAKPCGASGACREVPDVSADADPGHGYVIYYNGDHSVSGQPSGWQATGGTSGAAPLWAAVFAEANADSACQGIPIGFANPALYRAAATAPGAPFQDVVGDDNDFSGTHGGLYPATSGYDMATGLGTPNVLTLSTALCQQSLRVGRPRSFQSDVGVPHSVRVPVAAPPGDPVSFTATGLPRGVSIDPGSGTISGTPTRAGTDVVKVTASDGTGALRGTAFVWNVAGPASLSHLRLSGVAGGRPVLSLRVSAGRAEAPLSKVELTLPAGLSLSDRGRIRVQEPAGDIALAHRISVRPGAGVDITLIRPASPVWVDFAAGSLRATPGLRQGRTGHRVSRVVAVVVRDALAAMSHLSARVTSRG